MAQAVAVAALGELIKKMDLKIQIDANELFNHFIDLQNKAQSQKFYVCNGTNTKVNLVAYNGNDWMLNSMPFMAVAASTKTLRAGETNYLVKGGAAHGDEGLKVYFDNKGDPYNLSEDCFYIWNGTEFKDITSTVVKNPSIKPKNSK